MKTRYLLTPGLACLGLVAASADAGIITLLPDIDIHLNDTTTASFDDGNLALTPLAAGSPTTFNGGTVRLGIDDPGTGNPNAFFGPDEQLRMVFAPNAGLTQLGYDFTSTGANGVVEISGFTADPGASISGNLAGGPSTSYDAGSGTLTVFTTTFNGADTFLDLANPAASAGQTLLITPTAQFPITSISYEDAVPEPGSLALLGLGGLLVARRRRG